MAAARIENVGKLTVTIRNRTGKGAARQLRAQGKVPGVCYGASPNGRIEPMPIIVDVKALRAALDPVRKQNTVINLTIEGGAAPQKLHALVKEYQIHPLRREITHVDLLAIDPNKEVHASVPLEFIGKPKGAIDGGEIRTVLRATRRAREAERHPGQARRSTSRRSRSATSSTSPTSRCPRASRR